MEPGSILGGRYRIVRELGRGGMGVVYEAMQEELRRPVAVKVMGAIATGPEELERFLREARIAASVTSPHLVNVLDFSSGPPPFLVMELLTGVTLAQRLLLGPMSEPELVALGLQITSVLSLVHDRGVIHRDIKPANLFHTEGSPENPSAWKLLDFGVAKLAESTQTLTQGGGVLGTVPYMSPEQLFLGGDVSPSADLYSLGVCLFEAASGRKPTTRSDLAGIVAELHTSTTPPLKSICPRVSDELAAIVDRALARSPTSRFASAREMHAALQALATRLGVVPVSSPLVVPSVGPANSSSIGAPPKRGAALLGGAVVVTIAMGMVVGALVARRSRPAESEPSTTLVTTRGAPIASVPLASASVSTREAAPNADGGGSDAAASRNVAASGSNEGRPTLLGACGKEKEGTYWYEKNLVCLGGRWSCRKDLDTKMRECGDRCDPIDDSACTACNVPCPGDRFCTDVKTSPRCEACGYGTTLCHVPGHFSQCRALEVDPFNCGRCGHVCSGNTRQCVDGQCQ